MLSVREFEALLDYSCSLPTGQTIGKRWRRREPYVITETSQHEFYMGEYVESLKRDMIGIEWTKIILPPGYVPFELRNRSTPQATTQAPAESGGTTNAKEDPAPGKIGAE